MLKYFSRALAALELPHVTTYKWKWLRRVMIIVTTPQEIVRALYGVFLGAKLWWNWDGTRDADNNPVVKL